MSDHVELEGQVICDGFLKIFLRRDLVIKVVERVQPFIIRFNSGFHHELGRSFPFSPEAIQQALFFILGGLCLHQSDVFSYHETVIFKIKKLHQPIFGLWFMSRKDSNTGIYTDAVKGVFIQGNHGFQRVIF